MLFRSVPMDSLEISLFEEIDACYTYDHDSPIKNHPKSKKPKGNMFNNGIGKVMTSVYFDHTILELNKNCVFVDHEKYALCYNYIVDFVHYATENYYERGKYGYRNFHVTKTSLFTLKILKLLLFYIPMLDTLFFMDYLFTRFLCIGRGYT